MEIWKEKQCSTPKDNECHSLQWPWINKNTTLNTINYFALVIIIFIILYLTNNFYLKIFIIYLLLTLIISISIKPLNNSEYSHWCFFAIGLPLIKLIIS